MYCSCLDTIYDPGKKKCSITNVLVLLHKPLKKIGLKTTQTENIINLFAVYFKKLHKLIWLQIY